MDWNERFSDELLLQILKWVGVGEVLTVSLVCKRWRILFKDPLLWRSAVLRDFSSLILALPSPPTEIVPFTSSSSSSPSITPYFLEGKSALRITEHLLVELDGLVVNDSLPPVSLSSSSTASGHFSVQLPPPLPQHLPAVHVDNNLVVDADNGNVGVDNNHTVEIEVLTGAGRLPHWREVYLLCEQIMRGRGCSCRTPSCCSCGCEGLELWQLCFSEDRSRGVGGGERYRDIRREIFKVMRERISEEEESGRSLDMIPANQLSSSQLRLRKRKAAAAAAASASSPAAASPGATSTQEEDFKFWRLKPCPVSRGPQLVEWVRFRSLTFTLSLNVVTAAPLLATSSPDSAITPAAVQNFPGGGGGSGSGGGELEWPRMRITSEVDVDPVFRLKCSDSSEQWGIKVSCWSEGFQVEYYVKRKSGEFSCICFGRNYELTSSDLVESATARRFPRRMSRTSSSGSSGSSQQGVGRYYGYQVPDFDARAELEMLCSSSSSFLRTVNGRFKEFLRSIRQEIIHHHEHEAHGSPSSPGGGEDPENGSTSTATTGSEGLRKKMRRVRRMRKEMRLRREIMEEVSTGEKVIKEKVRLVKKHHQEIHAALSRLLPPEIRRSLPFSAALNPIISPATSSSREDAERASTSPVEIPTSNNLVL